MIKFILAALLAIFATGANAQTAPLQLDPQGCSNGASPIMINKNWYCSSSPAGNNQIPASSFTMVQGIPGAAADGTGNDAYAIQNYLDSIPSQGGVVYLGRGKTYKIATSITIPPNVTVDCQQDPGSYRSPPHADAFVLNKLGGLRLVDPAQIIMSTGARLEHCPIFPSGMVFPLADASTFTSTTAILYPAGLYTDDTYLVDNLIVGFNYCVDSNAALSVSRFHWLDVECDATNGFRIGQSLDSSEFSGRTYTWATVGYPGGNQTRSGTGLSIPGTGRIDDLKAHTYTDFGHAIGIDIQDAGGNCCNLHFGNVWLDNNATTGLRAATSASFDKLWIWGAGGPGITGTGNPIRIGYLYVNGATNCIALSGSSDLDAAVADFYNCTGVLATLATNTNRLHINGGIVDTTVAVTPYVTLTTPSGMASDAVMVDTKYASGLGSNLLSSTSIVPIRAYGDAMLAVTGISAPMLAVTGPGQQTSALTDSGAMGGTLLLKGSGNALGDGGALLFGANKGHTRHFCAIKGMNISGSNNTAGDIDFACRYSDADTSLTANFHADHTGYIQAPKVILFTAITACAAGLEGSMQAVSDSNTNTWGANIAGSGANHVMAYCNGTNWTVMGK